MDSRTATRSLPLTSTHVTPTYTQSPSVSAQASSGMSTIAIIGGIGGALAATVLATVIVAFFLVCSFLFPQLLLPLIFLFFIIIQRRWRRKKAAATEDAFDASRFRRSAVLLDENGSNDTHGRPRPPSMIERRNVAAVSSLSPPSAAYPSFPLSGNEDTQSFAPARYRAVPPDSSFTAGSQFGDDVNSPTVLYTANPYSAHGGQGELFSAYPGPGQDREQHGYGAPPVPGIHGPGAYAPYGVDPGYPQSQQYPRHQQFQNQQHSQQYQHELGQNRTSLTREEENTPELANPFSPLPVSRPLDLTEGPGPEPTPTSASSASPNSELTRGASSVTRQSRQSHEAPPAYTNNAGAEYADMKKDVNPTPSSTLPLSIVKKENNSSDSAVPDTNGVGMTKSEGQHEPASRPQTIYDDEDAYGGI